MEFFGTGLRCWAGMKQVENGPFHGCHATLKTIKEKLLINVSVSQHYFISPGQLSVLIYSKL